MRSTTENIEAVERALTRFARKPSMQKLTRRVIRTQNALQKLVTRKAWTVYLKLEEAVNERDFEMVNAAIRLALRQRKRRQ